MPNFKNFFSSAIVALVPLVVAAVLFFKILSTDKIMQNNFKNVLGASVSEYNSSFSTPQEQTNYISNILDSILKVSEPGTTGFFNKIKLAGRVEQPVLFDLEDNEAYLWLSQGKTKLYISAFGEEKVEILTDKFFNRDLNFKKDINISKNLNVFGDTYFWGGMQLTGNFSGSTATLSSAYISGDVLIGKNLTTDTFTGATAYLSDDLTIDGNLTGTTATLSSVYLTGDLWVDENITSDTATIANAYISGTLTSVNGRFTRLFANDFSAAAGRFPDLYANRFSAAQGLFTTKLDAALFSAGASSLGATSITGNLNASSGVFTDLFATRFSTANGNLTDLFATRFSASAGFMTNLGVTTNFSAGSSTLGATTINGNINATGGQVLIGTGLSDSFYSLPASQSITLLSNRGKSSGVTALAFNNSHAAANTRNWSWLATNDSFQLQAINDSWSASIVPMVFYRTGLNVTQIDLNATTRFWNNGNNRFEIGLNGITATTGITGTSLGLSGHLSAPTIYGSTWMLAENMYVNGAYIFNYDQDTYIRRPAENQIDIVLGNSQEVLFTQNSTRFNNTVVADHVYTSQNYSFSADSGENSFIRLSNQDEIDIVLGASREVIYTQTATYFYNTVVSDYLAVGISTTDGYRLQIPNIGDTTGRGRANAWVTYSDQRLKENRTEITGAIATINSLNGVYFNWKDSGIKSIGFIAQEVEPILPEIVDTDNKGIKSMDYAKLTPVLVQGIKEQQTQINSLSQAIANINISNLENLTTQLMTTLENLSMSTEDGALVVNTNLTVTGEALLNNATFTGNVEIGQVKIDSLENDISIKAASCVDMDGNMNQETCDSNKLNIMQNKAGNVEMFDGQVKFKPNGEVLGEKVQAKTFKNTPSSAPEADASCNAGEFKFAEDNGKVYVFFCSESVGWVRSELSKY